MLRHSGQYIAGSVLPCHRYISYARVTYLTSRLINARHEKCDGEFNEGNALTMFQHIKKGWRKLAPTTTSDSWPRVFSGRNAKTGEDPALYLNRNVSCNSIMCLRAVKMALYDDSLETLVTSTKRHNSPYKVGFMGKLASFPAGTLLFHEEVLQL